MVTYLLGRSILVALEGYTILLREIIFYFLPNSLERWMTNYMTFRQLYVELKIPKFASQAFYRMKFYLPYSLNCVWSYLLYAN